MAEEEYFGHFTEQALELGLIGMEAENLHLAIEEEAFEADVMYRDFQAQAQADTVGDHPAAEQFRRLRQDERRNRDQFLTVLRTDPGDAPAPAAAAHPDMGRLHLAAPAAAAARGPLGRVVVPPSRRPTEPGSHRARLTAEVRRRGADRPFDLAVVNPVLPGEHDAAADTAAGGAGAAWYLLAGRAWQPHQGRPDRLTDQQPANGLPLMGPSTLGMGPGARLRCKVTTREAPMKVSDLQHHELFIAQADECLEVAADRMNWHQVGALPVIEGQHLVGIITERDLTAALAEGADPVLTPVSDYMTQVPEVLGPDSEFADAAHRMLELGVRHLPVVRSGQLVGVLSMRDVLNADTYGGDGTGSTIGRVR